MSPLPAERGEVGRAKRDRVRGRDEPSWAASVAGFPRVRVGQPIPTFLGAPTLQPGAARYFRFKPENAGCSLVIVDSAGTLRFATPPSLSFDEYHGLAHALAALAGSTP